MARDATAPDSAAVVRINAARFGEKNSDAHLPDVRGPRFSESRVNRRARAQKRTLACGSLLAVAPDANPERAARS